VDLCLKKATTSSTLLGSWCPLAPPSADAAWAALGGTQQQRDPSQAGSIPPARGSDGGRRGGGGRV